VVDNDNPHENGIPIIKRAERGDRYPMSPTSKLAHRPAPNHTSQNFNFQRSSIIQSLGKDLDDFPMPTPVLKARQLMISDQNGAKEYYTTQFTDLGMDKREDDPGGPREDIHLDEFLVDGYPGIELDGWIIRMESHVTISTPVRPMRYEEKVSLFASANISSNFRSSQSPRLASLLPAAPTPTNRL
jgi:hypothetical protein